MFKFRHGRIPRVLAGEDDAEIAAALAVVDELARKDHLLVEMSLNS